MLQAAGIAVYGPRTTMTIAVSNLDYAHEFLLVDDFSARHGQWVKVGTDCNNFYLDLRDTYLLVLISLGQFHNCYKSESSSLNACTSVLL